MTQEELKEPGCIEGGLIFEVSENDYRLGAGSYEVPIKSRPEGDDKVIEYNQLDLPNGRNACTVHACVGALSDYWWVKLTSSQLQEIWDTALEAGASESTGWYFYKAVDHVRKWWNRNYPEKKVVSFRIQRNDPALKEALDAHHSLVCGYKGNKAYNEDANDGSLTGTDFKPSTYGHCVRRHEVSGDVIVDNYLGIKPRNVYKVEDFDALIDNGVFFNEFYLYLPMEELTQDQKDLMEAQKLGIWNGKDGDQPATRREVALMVYRANKK